jgi:HNH endonuclease/NUMOD4 motif-containing protein
MEEVWKAHPLSDDYEFSTLGQVRSYRVANSSKRRSEPRILKQSPDRKGYLRIRFYGKHTGVHRLVAETFHGFAPTEKHQAAHKNGIASDNRPDNLYWATNSENTQDKVRHGTHNWLRKNRAL